MISRVHLSRLLCVGGFLLATAWSTAADWPGFRGPNATGVFDTPGLPTQFGPDEAVIWKTPLPRGKSSPVLTEHHIFLTAHEAGKLWTLALDRASGKVLWRRDIVQGREERLHKLNSPASASPATDGENAYVFFGDFGLASYGPDGNERWRLALGPFTNLHGMSASPIVVGDKVIIACDQDEDAYLLAVHKDTGEIAWKTARPEVVHGFSTTSVFRPGGGAAQIIVPGSYQLIAYSADSGEKLWWVRGMTWQVKPAAVVAGETIYATGWAPGAEPAQRKLFPPFAEVAKEADANQDKQISPDELPEKWKPTGSWRAIDLDNDGLLSARDWKFYRARRSARNATMAVRPGNARGDLTETHVLWEYERAVPVVPSPVLYGGVFYIIKNGGILTALDPETGAVLKQGRLTGAIDNYYASPVAGDGKLYFAGEVGKIGVVKPGGEWELLTVNDMGEPVYASPAIGDRRLYVRTESALYAFGQKE